MSVTFESYARNLSIHMQNYLQRTPMVMGGKKYYSDPQHLAKDFLNALL
ncbi:MAG UNVERIFIED_CONTAM: hypothetical protein LVQ98_03450 [Rickettsiaceae bacterium]